MQNERKLNNISLKIGDMLTLPFDDSSFSLVITRYSFHHLLYPQKDLDEIIRVCKPDGRIVIIDVTPESSKVDEYNRVEKLRDSSHIKAFTFKELSNMMEEAGLINLETKCQNLEMELDKLLEASFPNNDEIKREFISFLKKMQKKIIWE
jgi:ubiquinone/menaquinone biosynthesis C-methylase UbiE